jgi:hypothetical protein
MNKLINGNNLDKGAVPPKPPAKIPKSPIKPDLQIISLTPPTNSSKHTLQSDSTDADDLTPIPAPSSTLQYRAIGVVFGRYIPSSEHFCKGKIMAVDGTVIEAVVLGRVMPILQKKLNLEKPYLWVVYPRTVNKTSELYMQISGVWAPKETGKIEAEPHVEDGYFSIRGEVIEQSIARNYVVIKIKRLDPEKKLPRARSRFKLKLKGILPSNALGYFWDIKVQRQSHNLTITYARAIALIPKKPPKKPIRKPDSTELKSTQTNISPTSPIKRPKPSKS